MPSQEVVHISPTEVTPELGKGALDTWRPSQPYGGRLDKTGTYAGYGSGGEAVGKPGVAGVHTNQRLSLSQPREGPRKICQGFKPDPGNLAVRHYRGASRNVRHGEIVIPSCNRKSGNGNPSPTAGRARSLSQPWTMDRAKRAQKAETPKQPSLCLKLRAPYLYPDQRQDRRARDRSDRGHAQTWPWKAAVPRFVQFSDNCGAHLWTVDSSGAALEVRKTPRIMR